MGVSIVNQMTEQNDIPCLLVPLLELRPWERRNTKGELERYDNQKWEAVPASEEQRISKIEAQVWLTIFNMFACQDANRKYEITTFRK